MMSTADLPKLFTAEFLLSLPDDGIQRELINGELRERGMTLRNADHSEIMSRVSYLLLLWLESQPKPRGKVLSGDAGFRLKRDPDTFVGVDVAYVSPDVVSRRDFRFFDEPPVLAVEILSPSDKHEDIVEKVQTYLEVGTIVWVIDPDFRTINVHRPGQSVQTHNDEQELVAGPELAGFRVAVARIFNAK